MVVRVETDEGVNSVKRKIRCFGAGLGEVRAESAADASRAKEAPCLNLPD